MVMNSGFVRAMERGEEAQVDTLLRDAFGGEDEVRLVHRLRRDGSMAGESVLPGSDGLFGYYALSWMRAPEGWLCLAPVAIRSRDQRCGHGRRMIRQLGEWARLSGTYVVVLGDPGFYGTAGFDSARARHLAAPYPVSHLLLAGPGDAAPQATLVYPAAFAALD